MAQGLIAGGVVIVMDTVPFLHQPNPGGSLDFKYAVRTKAAGVQGMPPAESLIIRWTEVMGLAANDPDKGHIADVFAGACVVPERDRVFIGFDRRLWSPG